ncbi:restriction endonuclease subunit S [Janthinobacterium violaceinigrum]|uniref:Restriction endonuclease subunit S n=1 Tax=Janthinobacterium violaceinigrum TaxID=2654252 RepID=A0A6I1HNA2_9BURK|nr:restriction endonuclease subunit S [Janthinobacterium violaceinigrum]KAB8060084.1 restriction endonuclease subunit S [Janthinobacterium violaceinigrum]
MMGQLVRLGDVADMMSGFAFKSQEFLDNSEDGIYLVRGDNVQQGFIRWGEKAKKWRNDAYDDLVRYHLQKDDVILAMDRPIVGGGLKLAWIRDEDLPSLLVQRVTRIRGISEKAKTNYLRYVLSTPSFLAHIDRITTGANIPHISGKDIASFEFRLPNIDEQDRIVDFIVRYDHLIETNQRRIALLEEAVRMLYREWFVNLRCPGAEVKGSGLPIGWASCNLGDLVTLNYGKSLKDSVRIAGDIPVYGSSGIVGANNHALVNGSAIIVGRKGNVGSVYYSATSCFPIDTVYYVDGAQATYYNYLLLESQPFVSSDTAVPGLNRTYAYSLPVLRPSDEALELFEQTVTPLFDQVKNLGRQEVGLQAARNALLPKIMSGEFTL